METFHGYPVLERSIQIGGRRLTVVGPANYEQLIDDPRVEARFAQDEYLPYWAEFWPAAMILAERIALWPPADQPAPRVLELGCGLGLLSLVALGRGYMAIASDYDEDALAFVVESARRSGLPPIQTRTLDWRETYPDLRVPRIVAAEVLYENRHVPPIAQFVKTHLSDGGEALLCDARRRAADGFAEAAQAAGLKVDTEIVATPGAGPAPACGRLFTVRHA